MKILYITTISLTINSFFKPHIEMLVKNGNSVDIACNCSGLEVDSFFNDLSCNTHQIDFSRSPISADNVRAYKQLKKLIQEGQYDIVHCHTPNASIITRLVCRKFRKKNGLKVFYTAHGFHFYKGAPKLNWMIYYPIEKFCSRFTDKLITINHEDYDLANSKFSVKQIEYVPGVGIDMTSLRNIETDRNIKRREIGVDKDAFLLFSVGELNDNKNHQLVIKALSQLSIPNVHYVIAGVGDKRDYLLELASNLGVEKQVHLLGYRNDIPQLNYASDVFCFPSYREGLSVSLMEAMASGKPVVCSCIRGNVDLVSDGNGFLFSPYSVEECKNAIEKIYKSDSDAISQNNLKKIELFSISRVLERMKEIYGM